MVRNVLYSWGGYVVYLVAGMVMPRLISDSMGQETLGVWDFAWSLIGYFGLLQLGIGASIGRYVGKYWSVQDIEGLNRSISTIWVFQLFVALIILMMSFGLYLSFDSFFKETLGDLTNDARDILILIVGGLSVQVALGVYTGIITGVHRWDIHNIVNSSIYFVTTCSMIISITVFESSIVVLAAIHVTGTIFNELIRSRIAKHLYPEMSLKFSSARLSIFKEQFHYSAKTLMPRIGGLAGNETTNVLILMYLGPAALAVFARPIALIRHVKTLIVKYANILVPTVSSMQAAQKEDGIRTLFLTTIYYGSCVSFPIVVTFLVLGDSLVYLWMGEGYAEWSIIAVLFMGYLPTLIQEPIWGIFSGLNKHGKIGLYKVSASLAGAALTWVGLSLFDWGLFEVAVALIAPLIVIDGLLIPIITCRAMSVDIGSYLMGAYLKPLLLVLPFASVLYAVRIWYVGDEIMQLLVGSVAGGGVLLVVYWSFVFPKSVKIKLLGKLNIFCVG